MFGLRNYPVLTIVSLCLWFASLARAQDTSLRIVINEAVSSNGSTLADEDGDFSDWIEIYNAGSTAANLTGWGLSDDPDEPLQWTFPSLSLDVGQYLVIWASDKDRRPDTPPGQTLEGLHLHTNFKISAGGEPIVLARPDGTIHDRVDLPELEEDVSYGRNRESGNEWFRFSQATPNASNTTDPLLSTLEPPGLSLPAGFYTAGVTVSATHAMEGVTLRYTLDGAIPSPSSPVLDPSITLDSRVGDPNVVSTVPTATGTGYWGWNGAPSHEVFKINTLRVRAFKDGYLPSPVTTASYLIDPAIESRYTLPVVSLVTDADNLFDPDSGIFVNENYLESGREWEREVHFELFVDQQQDVSLDMGMRIHGGQSRLAALKSMRFYARGDYGASNLEYPLFPDKSAQTVYDTFILRTGGNNWGSLAFRDGLAAYLMKDVSTVDIQYYRPTSVFINGEYWGLLALRDRFDNDYIKNHYDISDVDMLEGREVDEGSADHYEALLDYMAQNDISIAENFAEVSRRMDVDNFRDYCIAQSYYMNIDQPARNVRLWRSQNTDAENPYADGRWRWLLYDLDLGMAALGDSLAYMTASNRNPFVFNTTLEYFDGPFVSGTPQWGEINDPQDTFPLRTLLGNPTFRRDFINRFADLLNTTFRPARVRALIDQFADHQRHDIGEHLTRWKSNQAFWEGEVNRLKRFGDERAGFLRQHIVDFFRLPGQATVTVNANPSRGKVQVNSMIIDQSTPGVSNPEAPYPWVGTYFQDVPVTLIARPEPGYVFSHWEGISSENAYEDAITLTPDASPLSVTAVFFDPGNADLIYGHPVSATEAPGGTVTLSVNAYSTNALSYQWFKAGIAIAGATDVSLTFDPLQESDAGYYTVQVTDGNETVTSRAARITVAAPESTRISNLSIRSVAGINATPLIIGMVMDGGSKEVLLRAVGPTLANVYDIEGVLPDPQMVVYERENGSETAVGANDNWAADDQADDLSQLFAEVGAFPLPDTTSGDAALLASIDGPTTVHVNNTSPSQSGVVLVEGYDTADIDAARLVNLSARNFAGVGDETLIAGFVIEGNSPTRLLVRGVGPSLADKFGLTGVLENPRLEVRTRINDVDTLVAENDDWFTEPGITAASSVAGAFALSPDSKDAALILTLQAGAYTVHVAGADNESGEALVEIYQLP